MKRRRVKPQTKFQRLLVNSKGETLGFVARVISNDKLLIDTGMTSYEFTMKEGYSIKVIDLPC